MRTIVWIIFLVGLCCFGYSQNTTTATMQDNITRLKQQLATAESDTTKNRILFNLSNAYRHTNMDSTHRYAMMNLELAKSTGQVQRQLGAMSMLGLSYIYRGNLPKALGLGLEAIRLGKDLPVKNGGLGPNLDHTGSIYLLIGDYVRALKYFRMEVDLGPEVDKYAYAFGFWNIASVYEVTNQLDSALIYLDQSFKAYQLINDDTYPYIYQVYPEWYDTRAKVYIKQNQLDLALKDFHQSLSMSLKNNEKGLSSKSFYNLAHFYKDQLQGDSSIYYAEQALSQAQSISYTKIIMQAANLLAELYEKDDPAKALSYFKLANENQNKLYGASNMQAIRDMIEQNEKRAQEIAANELAAKNQLRQYLLFGGLLFVISVAFLLFRNNRITQRNNALLNQQKTQIENTLHQLKSTQAQLIQSEKMASLGELTAGIAHEIQNPLNFVNNFSKVSDELLQEMKEELEEGDKEEVKEIMSLLSLNLEKINHHGERASGIVKGMLQHSRAGKGEKEPTDINALCDEYLRLAYHGIRAKDKTFNATMDTSFDESLGKINIVPQDIGRVVLNLITNAFYAVNVRKQKEDENFKPVVTVRTRKEEEQVVIEVQDNGTGIPKDKIEKIFQPFFTTKPTGQGTGLGLSLSYDIVTKGHGGTLKVETEEGFGTSFIIELPIKIGKHETK